MIEEIQKGKSFIQFQFLNLKMAKHLFLGNLNFNIFSLIRHPHRLDSLIE